MSQLQAILNYQEVDGKLYKLERDFAASNERKEYVKVKKYLETAMEKLDALEMKATSLKAEAAELSKKVHGFGRNSFGLRKLGRTCHGRRGYRLLQEKGAIEDRSIEEIQVRFDRIVGKH